MKPIKINYIDFNSKRTSTTINGNIAMQYWFSTDECKNREDKSKMPDDYRARAARAAQKFVNEMKYQIDKDHIENSLIQAILAKNTDFYIGLIVDRTDD